MEQSIPWRREKKFVKMKSPAVVQGVIISKEQKDIYEISETLEHLILTYLLAQSILG